MLKSITASYPTLVQFGQRAENKSVSCKEAMDVGDGRDFPERLERNAPFGSERFRRLLCLLHPQDG